MRDYRDMRIEEDRQTAKDYARAEDDYLTPDDDDLDFEVEEEEEKEEEEEDE